MNQSLVNQFSTLSNLLGYESYTNRHDHVFSGSPAFSSWEKRILTQLDFGIRVSEKLNGKHDTLLSEVICDLTELAKESHVLTKEQSLAAEARLKPLAPDAKKYTMLMVSHAHIDMNWMWSYDETVAVTLDTFRTMLQLLKEYPQFTFSQSQASVYRIVEQYAPEMLEEIKRYVKEGRWEISASTWVEADKNMPSGESMARHLLYTKNYLSQLFDIPADSLTLDFEPDTFGHCQNVPEILSQGGVKYYYHCRGTDAKDNLYRWVAPSGKEVLVFCDPIWYLGAIHSDMVQPMVDLCDRYGMDTMIKVYGVGDHGGGPTRRDISRILDMQTWTVYPTLKFSTYKEFFSCVEKVKDNLPKIQHELNFVFTGCYTTQSRIKLSNRLGEVSLNEGETLSALSHLTNGSRYPQEQFREGWKNLLFNQFHDILTGSGVIETREYAMGEFQKLMASSNIAKNDAMRAIAEQIDTSAFDNGEDISETFSEGAGVGYRWHKFKNQSAERGAGLTRIFHVFNPTPYPRKETMELTLWNWNGEKSRMRIRDAKGNVIPHQIVSAEMEGFFGHRYFTVLLPVDVEGMGYATYIIDQNENCAMPQLLSLDPRKHSPYEYILENEYLRAEIDPVTGGLSSLFDKVQEKEMIDPLSPACFRYIEEATDQGMTSWVVGRYKKVAPLLESPEIAWVHSDKNGLRQSVKVTHRFASNSSVSAVISLDAGAKALTYEVDVEFNELGTQETCIPQLNFTLPVNYLADTYRYDVPAGAIDRPELDMDVPANSYGCPLPKEGGKALLLTSNCKYGFRGVDNSINLTLIRVRMNLIPIPSADIIPSAWPLRWRKPPRPPIWRRRPTG